MGMFLDNRNTSREGWKYNYKGSTLAEFAVTKYKYYTTLEQEARNKLAALMTDPKVSMKDDSVTELKKNIEKWGEEREKCMVWAHEFRLRPDSEYLLSMGDVTYFDLVTHESLHDELD
jgi:erythromycin esterase-like protein